MPFETKQQKKSQKNRKTLASSTNTRQSISRKQKSYSKKENISGQNSRLMNQSASTIRTQIQGQQPTRSKQSIKQMYFYDKYHQKYYKKQFPNISIIEERQSILSNQQNSFDSLNNFIIQSNNHSISLVEKSHEEGSLQDDTEDWTLLYNQYQMLQKNSFSELQYLQVIAQLEDPKILQVENYQQTASQGVSVSQQIMKLHQDIINLKQMKKNKQHNEFSDVLQNPLGSQSFHQEKSSTFNDKSLSFKLTKQILRKTQNALHKEQFIQSNYSNSLKLKIKISQDGSNKKVHTSDRLLQHLSEEVSKFTEQQNKFNEDENKFVEEEPSVHFESTQKQQDEFMKFMDKKYSEDNQPNLSLNNISNIMGVKPKYHHNKSIENQNQNEIKQKDDDEVVAMLENELRGKQIPQIPQIEETEILLKESRQDLCLNYLEGDIQNNIQTSEFQQEVSDQNKKIFFALQARQKWIKSLEKDENWKISQLAFLSKMKKILHNPYIEFSEE